jgi:hypothetical protein
VKSFWASSFLIPVGVSVVVAAGIVAVGETYLALGKDAIFLALFLMCAIVIVAAVLGQRTETNGKA